jgi:hypothetical protein
MHAHWDLASADLDETHDHCRRGQIDRGHFGMRGALGGVVHVGLTGR